MKYLHKIRHIYIFAIFFLLSAALLGIVLGATPFTITDFLKVVREPHSPERNILLFVRLPRVLACLVCGAALAVSGCVIQSVLANPLASPSIIGVNAGAGLGVTLCAAAGCMGGWQWALAAFLGAFAAVTAISFGAKKFGASRGTVILMGVAMNSLLGAISDTVITLVPDISMVRSDFRVGDFSAVTYLKLIPATLVILFALLLLQTLTNELDLLTLGEDTARSLGMRTAQMRTLFLLLAAALSGAAVSIAGLLSFVGLLVSHAVRRIATGESRHLIPLSALFGAGFVALCDTLSRVLFAPYELPAGILLAFLGAPFFLYILIRKKGGHRHA